MTSIQRVLKAVFSSGKSITITVVVLAAVLLPALFLFDPMLVIILMLLLVLLFVYKLYGKRVGQELVVGLLFALFITSYQNYVYSTSNYFVGKINVFPLAVWTVGLVLLRELYERYTGPYRFLVFSVAYLACLSLLEFVGYYFLSIQIAQEYPSLFGTGIIHGPPIIHIFYLSAGPLYLLVTDYLEVK